jgi:hypothetical protein
MRYSSARALPRSVRASSAAASISRIACSMTAILLTPSALSIAALATRDQTAHA